MRKSSATQICGGKKTAEISKAPSFARCKCHHHTSKQLKMIRNTLQAKHSHRFRSSFYLRQRTSPVYPYTDHMMPFVSIVFRDLYFARKRKIKWNIILCRVSSTTQQPFLSRLFEKLNQNLLTANGAAQMVEKDLVLGGGGKCVFGTFVQENENPTIGKYDDFGARNSYSYFIVSRPIFKSSVTFLFTLLLISIKTNCVNTTFFFFLTTKWNRSS